MGHPVGQTLGQEASTSDNPRLRLARLERGWDQDDVAAGLEELAALLEEPAPRVDGNLVSKWERGVRHPGAYYTPRLCFLFQREPDGLGFRAGPRLASECRAISQAVGRALDRRVGDVRRREFLQHLLWGGVALGGCSVVDTERILAAAATRADGRLLDDLHTLGAEYALGMHTAAPRALLPQVQRHLAIAEGLLRGGRTAEYESRLHLVAGTMSAVAGRLTFTLGNAGDANALYVAAEHHAQEAGDGPLRAYVLGQRSHLYSDLWRDGRGCIPAMAMQLLDAAHAAAADAESPWLRTWLHVRRAEEHASRGDARATHRDLERADQLLAATGEPDRGFFAHWSTSPQARLAGYRGNCAQLLGDSREATGVIQDALDGVDESLRSVRSTIIADLAMAYAKEGETEHAAELLGRSLDLCSDTGLVAHVQRVIGVRRHLSTCDGVPGVCHLDERIHQLAWVPL